jgi:hypothetical protein
MSRGNEAEYASHLWMNQRYRDEVNQIDFEVLAEVHDNAQRASFLAGVEWLAAQVKKFPVDNEDAIELKEMVEEFAHANRKTN